MEKKEPIKIGDLGPLPTIEIFIVEDYKSNWHEIIDSFDVEPGTYTIQELLDKIKSKKYNLEKVCDMEFELNNTEIHFKNYKEGDFTPEFLKNTITLKRHEIDEDSFDLVKDNPNAFGYLKDELDIVFYYE